MLATASLAQTPPVPLPPVAQPPILATGPAPVQGGTKLQLPAGWSILSLPVLEARALSGLDHQLYRQSSEGFVVVDPARTPLDGRMAYWTYSDRPQSLRVLGSGQARAAPLRLFAGWNLLGCPSSQVLPLANLSLQSPDGQLAVLEQAATTPAPGNQPWIAANAFRVRSQNPFEVVPVDIAASNATLVPGEALWLYVFQPVELLYDGGGGPRVASSRSEGQTVTLTGSGLDKTDNLTVQGVPIPAGNILQASPDKMVVRLPEGLTQGTLVPYQGANPGTRVQLRGDTADPLSLGLLSGKVVDSDGQPLAGAQVQVGEQSLLSGVDGRFYLAKLPTGTYTVQVTAADYKPGSGTVAISPGKHSTLLVSLSPTQPRVEQSARVYLTAYPYQVGQKRYWVKSIRAWQVGNYDRRSYDSWWIDASSRQLDWGEAPLGRRIRIEITWSDGRQEKFAAWDRRVYKDWQQERFYSPWD